MPRDLQRTKTEVPEVKSGGLDEFKTKERVTKTVTDTSFIKPGWAVGTNSGGSKINVFKIENFDEEVLIKFLEPDAFAPLMQHWAMLDGGKRKAYTCIVKECPLCARGDTPKSSDWLNVIDMHGDEPELKLWYASPSPAGAIKQRADNKRTSPINKDGLYFVAYKVDTKNHIPEYHLDPVREDELDSWGAKPLTSEQIQKFESEKYTVDVVPIKSKLELEEVARSYFGDD